jgi:hypothetical protein
MPNRPYSDRKTVALTDYRERLADQSTHLAHAQVRALFDNTDRVFVGDSNVNAGAGIEVGTWLDPGDVLDLEDVDLHCWHLSVKVAGEGVVILGLQVG